jgi:hypothetical protein
VGCVKSVAVDWEPLVNRSWTLATYTQLYLRDIGAIPYEFCIFHSNVSSYTPRSITVFDR